MFRHQPKVADIPVIEGEAYLDHQGTALAGTIKQPQKLERRIQNPRESLKDRYSGWQGFYIVRGIFEQAVALVQCLPHEAKFPILKVADTPMRHVGRRRACPGAEI